MQKSWRRNPSMAITDVDDFMEETVDGITYSSIEDFFKVLNGEAVVPP